MTERVVLHQIQGNQAVGSGSTFWRLCQQALLQVLLDRGVLTDALCRQTAELLRRGSGAQPEATH